MFTLFLITATNAAKPQGSGRFRGAVTSMQLLFGDNHDIDQEDL